MRVALVSRANLFAVPGGDSIQVQETARHLNEIGVEADVVLSNQDIDYSKYDLLHFFNIIRPADILKHINNLPYVISTIFVDYSEYELNARGGLLGKFNQVLNINQREYLKSLIRSMINKNNQINLEYFFSGHRGSIIKVLKHAELLLPNSHNEYKRLLKIYGEQLEYHVVPNGINSQLFNVDQKELDDSFAERSGVLSVGRIEGIKNQLSLIKALRETDYKLTIVGKAAPNHQAYYEKCREEAGSNVEFIDHLDQEKLKEYYFKAKVHVLPSWFETTGLVSLEAATLGCNVVVSDRGDTKEYFKDYVDYCSPDNIESILSAVHSAYSKTFNPSFRKNILDNFTWQKAAEETKQAYLKVLN